MYSPPYLKEIFQNPDITKKEGEGGGDLCHFLKLIARLGNAIFCQDHTSQKRTIVCKLSKSQDFTVKGVFLLRMLYVFWSLDFQDSRFLDVWERPPSCAPSRSCCQLSLQDWHHFRPAVTSTTKCNKISLLISLPKY